MNERISREEVVKIYDIEVAFFDELEAVGLIQTEVIDKTTYLHYDELQKLEQFSNWHYDLEVSKSFTTCSTAFVRCKMRTNDSRRGCGKYL